MRKMRGHFQIGVPFFALLSVALVLGGIIILQVGKMADLDMEFISEEEFDKIQGEAELAKVKSDPEKLKEEILKIDEEIKAVPTIDRVEVNENARSKEMEVLKAKIAEARANMDKEKEQVADYMAQIEILKKQLDEKTPQNPTYTEGNRSHAE